MIYVATVRRITSAVLEVNFVASAHRILGEVSSASYNPAHACSMQTGTPESRGLVDVADNIGEVSIFTGIRVVQ